MSTEGVSGSVVAQPGTDRFAHARRFQIGRQASLALLSSLVCLDLIFRYPIDFSGELGADTTFIHVLANSILGHGMAPWVLNPLSYPGLYALSYPSASPFLLASLANVSGEPISAATLFVSFAFSLVGTLSSYLVGKELRNDGIFPLLIAAAFSLAPFFVKESTWVGSSRGFVVALVPVAALLLLRGPRRASSKHLALLAVVFLLAVSLHRMGVLLGFVLIAYFFTIPVDEISRRLRFAFLRYERPAKWLCLGSATFGFVAVVLAQIALPGVSGGNIIDEYGSSNYLHGSDALTIITNIAISFTGKVGLAFPVSLLGIVAYTWQRPKEFQDKFVLVVVFILVPLLSIRDYISEFMIFPFVLVSGIGLYRLVRQRHSRQKLAAIVVIAFVVASGTFAWGMRDYWRNLYPTDNQVPAEVSIAGMYAKYAMDGSVISNSGLIAGQTSSVAGLAVLPLGGSSLHWFSAEQLVFGFQNQSFRVGVLPLNEVSFETDWLFVPLNVRNAEQDWETIIYNPLHAPSVQNMLKIYGVNYVLLDKSQPYTALVYTRYQPSPFLATVHDECYKTWDGPSLSSYLVR